MPFQIFRTVDTVNPRGGGLAMARFVQRVARWGGGANVTRTAADVSSPGAIASRMIPTGILKGS